MEDNGRADLLEHLVQQSRTLLDMTETAQSQSADASRLVAVRDQVFVIKETLGSLEVPYALVSRDEWSEAP